MFITVHDSEVSKRRWPEGRPIRVRAESIDTLRGYPGGRTRTVIGINGSYFHVTETEDEILALIGESDAPFEARAIPPDA